MKTSTTLGAGLAAILCLAAPLTHAISLKGTLPGGYTLMTINDEGKALTGSGSFSLAPTGSNLRLFAIDKNGSLGGPVILAVKRGNQYYTYKQAKKSRKCNASSASLVLGIAAGSSAAKLNLGNLTVVDEEGIAYAGKLLNKKYLDKQGTTAISDPVSCLPEATGNTLGLNKTAGNASPMMAAAASAAADASTSPGKDKDEDGLVDALDIDMNGNGILNPYDPETVRNPDDGSSFWLFSNLKLEIESSLNRYVKELTETDLNNAIKNVTLAIQVAGKETDKVELNCFGLPYCSAGGTGITAEGSKAFPDEFDSDSDGYGSITRGSTHDFQLRPNIAETSAVKGGDSFVEIVTDGSSGEVREIPGMLNFVFSTTPAIASIKMGEVTKEVSYPPTEGTMSHPFVAPADWDGVLTITAYRPQRVGIKAAGEGDFVDIGGSTVTIDLPNGPCSGDPCSGGAGPGNCPIDTYSNLSSDLSKPTTGPGADGLKDTRGDQDTDPANPTANQVSFSVDLNKCLNTTTWTSGQALSVDLQFRNSAGDNAAQKFRVKKP